MWDSQKIFLLSLLLMQMVKQMAKRLDSQKIKKGMCAFFYFLRKELYINKVKEKNKHIMSGIKIKNFKSESPTGESQRPRKSIY